MVSNIKVLKDNSKNVEEIKEEKHIEPYPRKLICECCKSELEYDESDLRMGVYGCVFVDCPICGYDNMLENNENSITLTVDNIEFPIHFHHTSVSTGAKDICNTDAIREYLRCAVTYFRNNTNEYFWYAESGNLFVMVHRCSDDDEYFVLVSKDFYSMNVPFQDKDY